MSSTFHTPVLLEETLSFLDVKRGKAYIDATIGGGGHGFEILKRGGTVLGIDVDDEAIAFVEEKIRDEGIKRLGEEKDEILEIDIYRYPNITLVRGNFKNIERITKRAGFEEIFGILFDLGVSSHQLDTPERGFSFQKEGPLDMRMDKRLTVRAMDLVNGLTKKELYELFTKLGEEHFAHAISDRIVRARGIDPITTTNQLRLIIGEKKREGIHPATRVFQALRIAVNDELHNLERALTDSIKILEKNGRIVVVSFHSLEDRIVKRSFINFEKKGLGQILTKKPVIPTQEEMKQNIRSSSAKLRAFIKQ